MTKIYLDDTRKPPFGWELVKTADECIARLAQGGVVALSLDHDLADEHYQPANFDYIDMHGYEGECSRDKYVEKTGYAVVQWMIANHVWPEHVRVHSLNPVGRQNMYDDIWRHAPGGTVIDMVPGWSGYDDE